MTYTILRYSKIKIYHKLIMLFIVIKSSAIIFSENETASKTKKMSIVFTISSLFNNPIYHY